MVAHKKPGLRVLEVDLSQPQEPENASSLWLESGYNAARGACAKHYFASADARAVVAVQSAHLDGPNSEFAATDFRAAEIAGLEEGGFNYALVRLSSAQQQLDEVSLGQALRHVRKSLADDGLAVFVLGLGKEAPADLQTATLAAGFTRAWVTSHVALAQVPAELNAASEDEKQTVFRLQLTASDSDVSAQAEAALVKLDRWNVVKVADPSQLPPRSKVLVLDELDVAIITQLDNRQWEVLQQLVRLQCNLVWVTAGAQMKVSAPEKAAIQGFLRVLRNEEPQLRLISLDVESATGGATPAAIDAALRLLAELARQRQANGATAEEDNELVERCGVIHVARVRPDATVNRAAREEAVGRAAELVDLHSASNMIRLRAERIGSIDSLHFVEASSEPLPLGSNRVEVEVMAAGVNFKEVAVTVGIVPENENLLGYEAAGVVVRVSPDVTAFKPGQRVVVFERGAHANRIIATTGRVRHIPDSMTFEEAASVPLIYMTSLWSLYRIARVRKGSRVLIHSAAGGVGLSAIQLCQHAGAEVFATVGTQDKREFLISQLNIPEDHIFSSRSRAFGDQILAATDGKGVDVVLNSLTGDLLDESWRIIAYGGTMVEIGKKDILDKNSLAMEPFRRNVTFASLDLSAHEITDEEFADLMAEVFGLIECGHVKPVWPRKIFSFTDIPSAFRLLRTGTHIGKIVLSDGPYPRIKVPVRPAPRTMRLRVDASYLIIGGLRGLCSSLAIHLAKNGAKHIAVLSRSGHDDPQSQKVVRDLHSLGAQVDLLRGDVCNLEDVRAAFAATSAPIAGIVQGAMVLRDRVFESMSVEEYHQALGCKIPGTLNLHRVSLELGLNLDFFTLLSSISGLTGSKGQANYAAGNAFMDSFAAYRRGLGLAATSVDLGVIQDVGYMAERDELQQRYDATVWHAINERLLRKIFGHAVILDQKDQNNTGRGRAHVITGIRVPLPEGSSLLRDPRFSALQLRGLQQAGGSGSGGRASDRAKDIQAIMLMLRSKAEPAAVLDAVVDVINRYLMTSLRLSEPLDAARPLSIYGIDSLAAVEFRNWLRADLGVDLSTLEIMNSPSLRSICEKVISKISLA
ncbi:Fumagillin dodecapentaenoate synthase [Corynascus novoguineensis]|uniref:Fumagillin dodecapentaenoate synthase n=1 Tax=Corynascus novoguineensis TaxID=1126955 RepID=A0AAN7HIQ7_9PEZI|nr:Fumagillin dodecapentaenoate synthase [Corynascus novoguineensis]